MDTLESFAEEIRTACNEIPDFIGVVTGDMIANAAGISADVDDAVELIGEWVDDILYEAMIESQEAGRFGDDDRLDESCGNDYWRNEAGEWRLG